VHFLDIWVEAPTCTSGLFLIPRILQRDWGHLSRHVEEIATVRPSTLPPVCAYDTLIPFVLLYVRPHSRVLPPLRMELPFDGMAGRRIACVGCDTPFMTKRPRQHACNFLARGFPFLSHGWALPCGVGYHADCIQAGEPFRTRLSDQKGLVCPVIPHHPHFTCELCQVRAMLDRELLPIAADLQLLLLERLRIIDTASWWAKRTVTKYKPSLDFLSRFGSRYSIHMLVATIIRRPSRSESISLIWAQLLYSLRVNNDGERIKFGSIRALHSAASVFYSLDQQAMFPGRLRRDKKRNELCASVAPHDAVLATFATKGIARRLGSQSQSSWALSYVHLKYINSELRSAYGLASDPTTRHELACAGFAIWQRTWAGFVVVNCLKPSH
jgi:hypothetical protein